MNKSIKVSSSIFVGIIVLIITLVIFFLGNSIFNKTNLEWLSLAFVLLSEIVLFTGITITSLEVSSTNKVLIRSGMISTLFVYWIITVICAVFKNVFNGNLKGYIVLQTIVIALTVIIVILLNLLAVRVKSDDERHINSRLLMDNCQKRLFGLKSNYKYIQFQKPLNDIYEMLKYGDKTESSIVDQKIIDEINTLEIALANNDDHITFNIDTIIDNIKLLNKQRNLELLQEKRGGF